MTSRRLFIKSGAMAMLSLGFAPGFLTRTVEAATGRRRLLVAIFQRGAVDGLNMVVPYGEADYYALFEAYQRGELAAGARADLEARLSADPRLHQRHAEIHLRLEPRRQAGRAGRPGRDDGRPPLLIRRQPLRH